MTLPPVEWWRAGPLVPSVMGALLLLLLWRVSLLEHQVALLSTQTMLLQVQVTHISDQLGR